MEKRTPALKSAMNIEQHLPVQDEGEEGRRTVFDISLKRKKNDNKSHLCACLCDLSTSSRGCKVLELPVSAAIKIPAS